MDLTDPTATGTIHIHWVVPFPLPLTPGDHDRRGLSP